MSTDLLFMPYIVEMKWSQKIKTYIIIAGLILYLSFAFWTPKGVSVTREDRFVLYGGSFLLKRKKAFKLKLHLFKISFQWTAIFEQVAFMY